MTESEDESAKKDQGEHEPQGPKRFIYFVDGERYESEHGTLTGLQIKTRIPDFDASFDLFEESKGNEPDRLVKDEYTVTLSEKAPSRFYTVPPATFGGVCG